MRMTAVPRALSAFFVAASASLLAAAIGAGAELSSPVRAASAADSRARASVPGQEALTLDRAALDALRGEPSGARIEAFPVAPGRVAPVVLRRFEVLAPGAHITVTGKDGESSLPFPEIAHFSGRVEGEPESTIYVGAQKDRLVAYVSSPGAAAYVGPDESGKDYVVRSADSPANEKAASAPWSCGAEEMPAPLTALAGPSFAAPLAPLAGLKQAAVRVETDQELLAKFPGATNGDKIAAMSSWIATLFAADNVAYERDLSLHLAISEVHAWTTTDPYSGATTLDQLNELGDWWHANRPTSSYPRTIVHYLSGRPVSGGIAWIGVLCSGDFQYGNDWGGGYGLTQVFGSYPLQMWDQYATAHEMGHNAGSPHTHCYSPPIDHCYASESGCYAGPVENPGPGGGTIMSYCHLLGWNYVSFVFHSRCVNETMLPEINSAACLTQASTFIDVPPSHPFYTYVEKIAAAGITGGCGGAYFCPDASVTRAQMAVFLLKAKLGSSHVPPAATGQVFADVPAGSFAAAWVEELASLGVTSGCGGGNYCPNAAVTRRQMATFLLKTKLGSSYVPPSPTGVFADVPMGDATAPWIEELYALTVTGGCLTNPLRYCPDSPNTRGQMAVFLVKTFGL
jgi:hypothetical protein